MQGRYRAWGLGSRIGQVQGRGTGKGMGQVQDGGDEVSKGQGYRPPSLPSCELTNKVKPLPSGSFGMRSVTTTIIEILPILQ